MEVCWLEMVWFRDFLRMRVVAETGRAEVVEAILSI